MEWENQTSPDALLKEAREIFEIRDKEYRKRENTFAQKEEKLKELLGELNEREGKLQLLEAEYIKKHEVLQHLQRECQKRETDVQKREIDIQKREKEVLAKEKESALKYDLGLEKLRNEELRLKRVREEYEYKLSVLENTNTRRLLESRFELYEDDYESKTEDSDQIREEVLVDNESEHFERALERRHLKESLEKEVPRNVEQQVAKGQIETETVEELNAPILKKYMEKNEPHFKNLKLLHSEKAEILTAIKDAFEYSFVFGNTSFFEIAVKRQPNSYLKKMLEKYNRMYPDTQFTYEKVEGKVYATEAFSNTLAPYDVMKRVREISECFSVNR